MTATIAAVPGVTPFVQIGVGDTRTPSGDAQWGADVVAEHSHWVPDAATTGSKWVGDDPSWYDVTCYVQDVETFMGRERAIDTWEVGTATVVADNSDGWADYPPVRADIPTELEVRPGRHIRLGVNLGSGNIVLWRGFIDRTSPGYDPETGALVTFDCVDAKGDAGHAETPLLATAVGANETASARVNRILDTVQWSPTARSVASSGVQLVATEMGQRAVDLLNLAADSAGGAVFGDMSARVAFRDMDWQVVPGGTPFDAVIGNVFDQDPLVQLVESPAGSGLYDPGTWGTPPVAMVTEDPAGSGLYVLTDPDVVLHESPAGTWLFYIADDLDYPQACPTEWEISFAREDIATVTMMSRVDEPPKIAKDNDGIAKFGWETFVRDDLETANDATLQTIANRQLAVRSYKYMPRIAAVTVDAAANAEGAQLLATVNPFKPSRVSCRHMTDDGRYVVAARTMLVVGIEHYMSPDGWSARIALDDATPYTSGAGAGRWFEIEDPAAGHWQVNTWQST